MYIYIHIVGGDAEDSGDRWALKLRCLLFLRCPKKTGHLLASAVSYPFSCATRGPFKYLHSHTRTPTFASIRATTLRGRKQVRDVTASVHKQPHSSHVRVVEARRLGVAILPANLATCIERICSDAQSAAVDLWEIMVRLGNNGAIVGAHTKGSEGSTIQGTAVSTRRLARPNKCLKHSHHS
jgi:hypothetical protein